MPITESISKTIIDDIYAEWALLTPLSKTEIHWEPGWYNPDYPNMPQITVNFLVSDPTEWFHGYTSPMRYISRDGYLLNIWVPIPAGSDGDDEEKYVSQMQEEAFRALVAITSTPASPIGRVLPINRGRALNELNRTPRLLRWEIPFWVNYIA